MRQLMCSWLWRRVSIGWATTQQLLPVLLELMHSCQPCRLPAFGSRLFSVSWSNCTQKWEEFARFLDSNPDESEAQSARCGCLSVMNYRFGCRFLLSSHTESRLKCCFIKVKLLHDTPNKRFPKPLDFFLCVPLRGHRGHQGHQNQNTSANKLTGMF